MMNSYFSRVLAAAVVLVAFTASAFAQQALFNNDNQQVNRAGLMLTSDRKLNIGGYGQIDYNQPFGHGTTYAGKLDLHRLVLLFGYRFTDKLSFVTEIEIEHVSEVYVEQAFINYAFNTYVNFRGGMLLIPMGIINEYHEPPTFNGVERPLIDKYIAPSTWREIGIGATGNIPEISMRYQAYLVNGFKSYKDGSAYLDASNGLRKGRQKAAESFIVFPNFAGRAEYYGVLGLTVGLSGYYGKTQSTMYHGLERNDSIGFAQADSSIVTVSMVGVDIRYNRKGFGLRGQFYYTGLENTARYNHFTSSESVPNNLGSSMYGYYVEASYNVFHSIDKIRSELIPFIRYSNFDTQATVAPGFAKDDAYNKTAITAGIGYWFVRQVALKTDVQFIKSRPDDQFSKLFNAGIAVMF